MSFYRGRGKRGCVVAGRCVERAIASMQLLSPCCCGQILSVGGIESTQFLKTAALSTLPFRKGLLPPCQHETRGPPATGPPG